VAIVTATQVTSYTDISTGATTITALGLIPIVQERITQICFNSFTVDGISLQAQMTFNATAATIVADTSDTWEGEGFAAGDEIVVYNSYRNDGYYTIDSLSDQTLTIASTETVVDELSGASILVQLVSWPDDLAYTAAQMVKYDYDDRVKRPAGLKSQSLGPWSETYDTGTNTQEFGYPAAILSALEQHRIARLM